MLAGKKPELFSLVDLKFDPVKGYFYKEELVQSEAPDYKSGFFMVEKVLATKVVRKKTYYLCKFLGYPR